jgi:hypothetical protein
MKFKTIIIFGIILLHSFKANAQIAYYDAIKLESYIAGGHFKTAEMLQIDTILSRYLTGFQTVSSAFDNGNNPYISSYFPIGVPHATVLNQSTSLLSSFGNLDVTNVADGFAKFIVKRVKEELSTAFFSKFKQELEKPEFVDMKTLFPQTYKTLQAIDDQIYMYDAYLQTLRESFEKDLSGLLTNLPSVISNHPAFFQQQPVLKAILKSGIYIAQEIQRKAYPGDILANFNSDYLDSINPAIKSSIQTLQLISASFRSKSYTSYWVPADSILIHFNDSIFLKLYLGLVYQQAGAKNIQFDATHSLQGYLTTIASPTHISDLNDYKEYTIGFINQIDDLEDIITSIKKSNKDSISFQTYHDYVDKTIGMIQYCTRFFDLPYINTLRIDTANFSEYFNIAYSASDVTLDISRRNYTSAIIDAYSIYKVLFKDNKNTAKKALAIAATAHGITNDKLTKIVTDTDFLANSSDDFLSSIIKYGSFMATIVQAKTSDDVETAIETFALPPGSYSVKRNSGWNISLNAYAGFFAGCEQISGVDKPGLKNASFNATGLTAPVGFSFSRGHSILLLFGEGKWKNALFSSTIFVSLVDLGAIVSYRFQNDTVAQVPTIQLKDIFSPGVFFSQGLPSVPISLNAGVQLGPNLRNVGTTANTYGNNTYLRYSLSILIDIPILNLYTAPKD